MYSIGDITSKVSSLDGDHVSSDHLATVCQVLAVRIGKVDCLVARLDEGQRPCDFATLEIQAVYFSGRSIRPVLETFLTTRRLAEHAKRRPEWRSSAQSG